MSTTAHFSVLGLSPESLNAVMQRVNTLELLLDKNDNELRLMLNHNVNIREEEVRRLLLAMFNLKRCREAITIGKSEPNELFWDSWDRHHHIHPTAGASPRAHRTARYQNRTTNTAYAVDTSVNHVDISIKDSDTIDRQNHLISPEDTSVSTLTPSPSPPNSPSITLSTKSNKKGFPTTPPAKKKHQTMPLASEGKSTFSIPFDSRLSRSCCDRFHFFGLCTSS